MANRDGHGRPPSREPIFRLITALLAADVAVGLALAVVGELVMRQRPVALAGLGLGLVGALLLLFFRRLGSQADRRQS